MFCVILPVLLKLRKTLFVSCSNSQKIFPVLRNLRQKNRAKPRKTHCVSCAKVRKKMCAKIAQILRKKYSHYVETLIAWYFNFDFTKLSFTFCFKHLLLALVLKSNWQNSLFSKKHLKLKLNLKLTLV